MNDEQVTFDGIPIPLTLETLLTCYLYTYNIWKPARARQRAAFRSRILMKFDAKEMLIQLQHMKISSQRERIAELEAEFNHYQDQYHE